MSNKTTTKPKRLIPHEIKNVLRDCGMPASDPVLNIDTGITVLMTNSHYSALITDDATPGAQREAMKILLPALQAAGFKCEIRESQYPERHATTYILIKSN
jgi:hypothetical protein